MALLLSPFANRLRHALKGNKHLKTTNKNSKHPKKNLLSPGLKYSLFIASLLSLMCTSEKSSYTFSDVQTLKVVNVNPGFKKYCELDLNNNFELNAVEASFYGDYETALEQATRRATSTQDIRLPGSKLTAVTLQNGQEHNSDQVIENLQVMLKSENTSQEEKQLIQIMLTQLSPVSVEQIFEKARMLAALPYIVEQAGNFHFTLINEAHYNSQHRAFTKELLKPLWDKGYRYLALEALAYEDKELHQRGYPVSATGYYINDSHFGNLVREALALGYQLITYETQTNIHDNMLRDGDQAHNIYSQTLQKDKDGKVLIHAGYSHIAETGDQNYAPMGSQLKKLAHQDILTIDQQRMSGLNDLSQADSWYAYATHTFNLAEPAIFVNAQYKPITDPINSIGIDIQVYHPATIFKNGRPTWMMKPNLRQVLLPEKLQAYEGCLVQATNKNEVATAVPVDQFIISKGKPMLLPVGSYAIQVINRRGELVCTANLSVH
jgi:hypothetical protein